MPFADHIDRDRRVVVATQYDEGGLVVLELGEGGLVVLELGGGGLVAPELDEGGSPAKADAVFRDSIFMTRLNSGLLPAQPEEHARR